jgi:hypothetical protein
MTNPDLLYELQSKRGLALSGLPTPATEVHGFDDCMAYPDATRAYVDQAMNVIRQQEVPFVLKLQQSISGGGTYIVRTEEQRSEFIAIMQDTVLPRVFVKVNESNRHLHPSSLILQEVVSGSGDTFGVTFFVDKIGNYTFIACTKQQTSDGNYIGSYICYTKQASQERRFAGLIEKIATYLHRRGYHGPCGADIMEEENGRQVVVDLNVRITSSMILGPLKGHFWERRRLSDARLIPEVKTRLSRKEFGDRLKDHIASGRVIVPAWFIDIDTGVSWVSVIVGGDNEEDLSVTLLDVLSVSC